ncbi:hypothetical protein LTR53_003549 [Teratosphaeriaceae sp. CCFEE 6253]|nr:hypothetical protein LTR53_003549 [Teratosphaeriaceae sp. CCFEE 6253]
MLSEIDNFRAEFKEEAAGDSNYEYVSECCSHAWQKVEKYYKVVDQTPIVYAAVIRDPRRKREWFRQEWTQPSQAAWLDTVTASVTELWRDCYMPRKRAAAVAEAAAAYADQDNLNIQLSIHKRVRQPVNTTVVDQLEECLATDHVPDREGFAPLQYCNLHSDVIEAAMCLRSWYGPPTPKKKGREWVYEEFDNEDVVEARYEKQQQAGADGAPTDDKPEVMLSSSELSDASEQ